jgi:hypothetical protein
MISHSGTRKAAPETYAKKTTFLYILIITLVILFLSTKGITDEGTVSLNGDMPRHMMNGAYFHDLIRDFPIGHPIEYTQHYFAKYPALSLGHHSLSLAVTEGVFYQIFGISVFTARLTILFFAIVGGVSLFLLVRSISDEITAFISALLYVSTPFIVDYSRLVMSEIPGLSLLILATYFFYRFTATGRNAYATLFGITFLFAILGRQQLVFMVPAYVGYFIISKGTKNIVTRKSFLLCLVFALMMVPIVVITLKYAQSNVIWILSNILTSRLDIDHHIKILYKHHLTLPVFVFSSIGLCTCYLRKNKSELLLVFWIICSYLLITVIGAQAPRYGIYWIPPLCFFAASVILSIRSRPIKFTVSITLLAVIIFQGMTTFHSEPEYASGYEEAGRFVVENKVGTSVLYSSDIDTGYFVFFVRKHDAAKKMVVLRADKLLATSRYDRIIEERISDRKEIYDLLEDYGVGYVVLEDKEYKSTSLQWLREEVKSDRFLLRKRVPIQSSRRTLQNETLAIYEYKGHTHPKAGKLLTIKIPLIKTVLNIPFDELLEE